MNPDWTYYTFLWKTLGHL